MTFFGGVFLAQGYSPDLEKVQGITEMPPPQTKQELQSFLGVVNYIQTFFPHLSHNTEPLWILLIKDNIFAWDENSNMCFQKMKSLLQKALWCFTQGTGSLHHSRWSPNCFCKHVPHRHWEMLCKHWEGAPSHHIWLWEVSHIPVW